MSKLDELKEKLSDFIEDLKKKLPLKGRSSDDDDDEEYDDEFDEDTGQVDIDPSDMGESVDIEDATETDISSSGDSEEDDDDEEDEDDDDEDEDEKKAKQKKLLIQGVLVVVLVYLAFDTFMNSDESNVVQAPPVNKRKKPRKKRRKRGKNKEGAVKKVVKKDKVKEETAPLEKKIKAVPVEKSKPAVVEMKKAVPVIEKKPEPVPTQIMQEKKEAEVKPMVTATPVVKVEKKEEVKKKEEKIVIENKLNLKNDASGIPPETPAEPVNKRIGETSAKGDSSPSLAMDKKVDEIIAKSKESKNSKIDEAMSNVKVPEEYVEPPNYKRLGRGLVYNCVGKHWACVDKFSYFQCRENSKWSTAKGKKPECVTKNVYASEKDCTVVQLHFINTGEATTFCENILEESDSKPETQIMVQ